MNVLLSIKPEYVFKIFELNKRFEYRKRIFKNQNIDSIFIYATSPYSAILGSFRFDGYLVGTPQKIWSETQLYSGITYKVFSAYFFKSKIAYAIRVVDVMKFETPIKLCDKGLLRPPQSFQYIDF